jgi:hypothetical protein
MLSVRSVKVEHVQDWLNAALAVILFVSPWVLGFAGLFVPAQQPESGGLWGSTLKLDLPGGGSSISGNFSFEASIVASHEAS